MQRTVQNIINDLRQVELCLSPENLTCDGELPRSQWMYKQKKLESQRKSLVKELGREPTFEELWGEN